LDASKKDLKVRIVLPGGACVQLFTVKFAGSGKTFEHSAPNLRRRTSTECTKTAGGDSLLERFSQTAKCPIPSFSENFHPSVQKPSTLQLIYQNAHKLAISGQNLDYLTAAVVEEQYHLNLLVKAGGKPVTGKFSFPHGEATFEHQDKFINTLDQLETAFESAYIAAIRDFALLGLPDYAVLSAQILTIEAEHRALGRSISSSIPAANNWAFTPVYVKSVADAAKVLGAEGYLTPKDKNSYTYAPVSLMLNKNVKQTVPYVVACS